jgi:F-type H+-transporting ATPase subunit epsilon
MAFHAHTGQFVGKFSNESYLWDGRDAFLAVGERLVEVTGDRVAIVTDMAVKAENIDEAKVEETRQRAEARLREKLSTAEFASVNASLARTLAQLRVKRRRRN